jgi:hypothetical protein
MPWAESQWAKIPRLQDRSGRAGGIRTHGLHVPNVALYQAEPQPVINGSTEVIARSERKQPLISPRRNERGFLTTDFTDSTDYGIGDWVSGWVGLTALCRHPIHRVTLDTDGKQVRTGSPQFRQLVRQSTSPHTTSKNLWNL